MEKPINLKAQEIRQSLIDLINDSGLPICIIAPIVKDIYDDARQVYADTVQQEQAAYEQTLSTEAETDQTP